MLGFARISALILVLGVVACGGNRAANPVQVAQSADNGMSCQQLRSEIDSTNNQIAARHRELDTVRGKRVRNAVFGGVIGLATTENGGAAKIEIETLQQRRTYLEQVAAQKNCARAA